MTISVLELPVLFVSLRARARASELQVLQLVEG